MKKEIVKFLIEIEFYRKLWYKGIIGIILLAILGAILFYKEEDIALIMLIFIWPFGSLMLWTALMLSNSRIIQANKKLGEKKDVM